MRQDKAYAEIICEGCNSELMCLNCLSGSNWTEKDDDKSFIDYDVISVGTKLKCVTGEIWTVKEIMNKQCKPSVVSLKSENDGRLEFKHVDELEDYEVIR